MGETTIKTPVAGFVHEYDNKLTAFEFKNSGEQSNKVVVFIGGLTDGLLTVPYLPPLSAKLDTIGWTLVQIHFSSSYQGWGTGSLARDADEISRLVEYLRRQGRTKIVLMGHSTGCQDTIQYITKLNPDGLKKIDGGIIQAPVSDREAILAEVGTQAALDELNKLPLQYVAEGRALELLPKAYSDIFFGAPINAYRWVSLATKLGDDDFFSTDLTPEDNKQTFGKVNVKLLILYSGQDEFVSSSVDKQKVIDQWKSVVPAQFWSEHTGIIPGARHNIGAGSTPGAVEWAVDRVASFLETL